MSEFSLNQREARLVFGHIGTPRGRDALVAEPRLVAASRANFSGNIEVFRVIQVPDGERLRGDTTACTSRCMRAVAHISAQQPGILFCGSNIISVTPFFLRYEVPAERVLADIPFLAEAAARALPGDNFSRRKTGQEPISKEILMDAARSEHEIIADLRGIKPTHSISLASGAQRMLFLGALLYGDGKPGDDEELLHRFALNDTARDRKRLLKSLAPIRDFLKFYNFPEPVHKPEPSPILSLPAKAENGIKCYWGKPEPAFQTR